MSNWGKVIYNKQKGVWSVQGKLQGKRAYFSGYRTEIGYKSCESEEEARLLQMVLSSEIANGTFNPLRYRRQKPLHIKKFATRWLNSHSKRTSESTYKAYRAAVKQIIEHLGEIFLPDLNYEHINDWVVNKMNFKLKTRKNYHGVLNRMLKDALRAGYITQMPVMVEFRNGLSIPQERPDWLDQGAFDKVVNEIKPEDRFIFRFLRMTGCRVGEGRALQKSDLYPDREYIMIRHTFSASKGGEILRPVKQKRERRIPFYAPLYDLFNEMPENLTPFVFLYSVTGRPYTKNINKAIWNPASLKALGYVFPLNNACRHSFANQLLQQGVDPGLVSNLLGHSDKKVLFRNYGDQWELTTAAKKVVDNVRKI